MASRSTGLDQLLSARLPTGSAGSASAVAGSGSVVVAGRSVVSATVVSSISSTWSLPASLGQETAARTAASLGIDGDGLVEAGQREDLAVVVAEAAGGQALALPLDAHEQRHEEADATTVHVVEAAEVEHDRLRAGRAGGRVGLHERALAGRGHVARDDDGGDGRRERPDVDRAWSRWSCDASCGGRVLVALDAHEVGDAGDLEDLDVVRAEPAGADLDAVPSPGGEDAHEDRDARAVDVGGLREVDRQARSSRRHAPRRRRRSAPRRRRRSGRRGW